MKSRLKTEPKKKKVINVRPELHARFVEATNILGIKGIFAASEALEAWLAKNKKGAK